MTIDEAIAKYKEIANTDVNCPAHCNISCDKCVQESEQLAEWLEELKAIKEMGFSIPQHFTKEQSDWIKAYCIQRNKEFYNKAIDDFVKFASDMPTVEGEDREIRPMRLEEIAERLKGRDSR